MLKEDNLKDNMLVWDIEDVEERGPDVIIRNGLNVKNL
jgi:hypothetical protein